MSKAGTEQPNPVKPGGSDGVARHFHNAYERKGRARLDVVEDHVRSVHCNDPPSPRSSLQPFQLAHNVLHEPGMRVLLDEIEDTLHIDAVDENQRLFTIRCRCASLPQSVHGSAR